MQPQHRSTLPAVQRTCKPRTFDFAKDYDDDTRTGTGDRMVRIGIDRDMGRSDDLRGAVAAPSVAQGSDGPGKYDVALLFDRHRHARRLRHWVRARRHTRPAD